MRSTGAFGAGLRIHDPAGPLQQAVHRLRRTEQVDLVVAVSHMGLPQDIHLAHTVEGIDVLLSGHTHDRLTHPIRVGKTLVMQSGFSGSFLGRLDLTVDRGQVVDFRHLLITLDDSIPVDAAVQATIDVALAPYRDRLAEVAGTLATPLHRMTVLEAPMDALITDAYLALTGADAAFSHGWRYGAPCDPARRYTVAGGGEQVQRAAAKQPTGVHAIAALRQHLAQQSPLRLDARPRFLAV